MIITEIQYFFSKIIRFQAIFKDTVEFTCALEFKISSQLFGGTGFSLCLFTLNAENIVTGKITENLSIRFQLADVRHAHPVVL